MKWETVSAPPDAAPPAPVTVRVQSIPPRHSFPDHAHEWHQVVYATSGVLTVTTERHSYVISPEQAVWLPAGLRHRVGSLLGADFRSLWIATETGVNLAPAVFAVSPLLKSLIIEAAAIQGSAEDVDYFGRIIRLIIDQLKRARTIPNALPWPHSEPLVTLCAALYEDPADPRPTDHWAKELGMSERTLARRFEAELGTSLRSWRRQLRLLKAIELMGGGMGVTATAMELGYSSTSAFVFAFRSETGVSPQAYMRSSVAQ